MAFFSESRRIAELSHRRIPRGFRRHSASNEFPFHLSAMKRHLFVKFVAKPFAPNSSEIFFTNREQGFISSLLCIAEHAANGRNHCSNCDISMPNCLRPAAVSV